MVVACERARPMRLIREARLRFTDRYFETSSNCQQPHRSGKGRGVVCFVVVPTQVQCGSGRDGVMFSSTRLGFEHLSQSAIDAIPAAVFLTTLPGGEILGANRCASEWCGRDVSSAGRLSDLLHSTDAGSELVFVADDPIASALRDGSVLRDVDAFLDTASSAIRVAVSIEAVRNSSGQPCVAVTLCSRMARTMNAAVDAGTNRRRMDLVLEGAQLGTWELDVDSRVLTSSPQCKANHGLGRDHDLQLESVILPAIDSEYRGAFRAAIKDAIESGAPFEMLSLIHI